ncbi:endospore germination permease [Alkalihalophilus pseudofirmus]|uniref:Endospore germination permease n=1 Tax=Alkalihalophilus pseudofirmus TaxID=79885 RepID=A0AAJ2NQJ4_ALKPS|nr:endospore germination permease [Alkalihalophilus pseudofirmus]MDV2886598.1 endospore germination permease [Alkalihalophilus pseudofirmus]
MPFGIVTLAFIVFLSIGLFAHVQVIPALLSVSHRDSWISILLTIFLWLVWAFVIYKILRLLYKKDIPVFLKKQSKSPGWYYVITLPFATYLFFGVIITIKDIAYWSQLTYAPNLSIWIINGLLLLFCFFCVRSGFNTIGNVSLLILPLVAFLGFFVATANIPKKHYELLLPLFENGLIPTFQGLTYTSLPIMEFFILFFIHSHFKKNFSYKSILVIGLLIIGLMLGPTVGTIVEFGPEYSSLFRYPAYEQWRILTIGKYFSNVDFFATFQWLSGGIVRISLFLFVLLNIFKNDKRKTSKNVYVLFLLTYLISILPIDPYLFYDWIFTYYFPIALFVLVIHTLFLLIILYKMDRKTKERNVSL